MASNEDYDEDGYNNYEEYRLGTDPTNRDSVMKLQISMQNTNGVTLTWPVANGRTYNLLTSGQLTSDLWTQQVLVPMKPRIAKPKCNAPSQTLPTRPIGSIA